jgi:uncharacterized phage-associated protein
MTQAWPNKISSMRLFRMTNMAKITATELARCFVAFCNEHGDFLSNLKLQKLLYYAEGWHLALYEESLFDDEIQAWIHGPVIPSVYQHYKQYGYRPIATEDSISDDSFRSMDPHVWEHIQDVWEAYGQLTSYQLEEVTQQEIPWKEARQRFAEDDLCEAPISRESMKEFFHAEHVS